MDFKKVAIIGVGLMGSSFALSLKKQGFKSKITGIGRREENLIMAKELGIIDEYSTVAKEGIKDADLILLATPAGQFERIIKNIRQSIKPGAIVTDVGSVKAEVVKKLEPLMPKGVSFVGGHPIAGKECSGINAAAAELFNGARCIITPTKNTNKEALEKIVKLWGILGSKVSLMTPEEHDLIFAAVSHLPHIVAYVLVNTIVDIKEGILHQGGRGLKDMTRIALSSPELWQDICSYNRENILEVLKSFSYSLSHIIELIESSDWKGLEKEFIRAKEARQLLESN
jgi:prephenate dehydrogenase